MELLDERWTMLVIRELLCGSQRFNDLRRGLPRMSPALLSRRLQQLGRAGLVERRVNGSDVAYVLTPAGAELRPVIETLAVWGTRWIGEIGDADLDPKLLLWDMHRRVDPDLVPSGRTVVRFRFDDMAAGDRDWWMVITPPDVDVCDVDPGFDVALSVTTTLRRLTEVWRGDRSWVDLLRSRELQVAGPEPLRRSLFDWFRLPDYADAPRPLAAATDPA